MSAAAAAAGLCLAAGGGAAAASFAGRERAGAALKMVAATSYVVFAVSLGAAGSPYGRLILVALAFGWLGDLFLIGRSGRPFLAGLGAFLLAHGAYAAAFTVRGVRPAPVLVAGGLMAIVAFSVFRWLEGASLPDRMRIPVILYLIAIGAMVALAVGGAWRAGPAAPVGALAFAASDLFVARDRFVRRTPANRLIGLPLYFAAQLLLASTVA